MTIVQRMMVGYANLLFLMIVVAALGMSGVSWFESSFDEYTQTVRAQVDGAGDVLEEANALLYIAGEGIAAENAGLRSQSLAELDAARTSTQEAIDHLTNLEGEDRDLDDIGELEELNTQLEDYHDALTKVIEIAAINPVMALANLNDTVLPLGQEFDDAVRSFEEEQNAEDEAAVDGIIGVGNILLVVMGVVIFVAILAGALLYVYSTRSVRNKLGGAVASLSSSSAEIQAIASQVSASAAQTAASTNEATATVEEVKQTAMLASEKAAEVVESTDKAAKETDDGLNKVEGTVTGIEQMQAEMETVSEAIDRLSERAQAAGDIIAAVSDLAEQSNLLSVNASIEAAKAGEYGKGFTVVAQEVKSLAEQSKQAVVQVRSILSEIQKASQTAVQSAGQGREAIEIGRRLSVEAGKVIQSLAAGASEVSQAAVQISASSRQQLAGMEQIGQAMGSINEAGEQSVVVTRQVEEEVKRLQDLALDLKSLVGAKADNQTEESD